MDLQPRYSNLKKEILMEVGISYSLEQLKEHFSTLINSRRALCRIKSVYDIMCLLEERDVLNCRNVHCLAELGILLRNNKIQELVQSYKKLFLDDIEDLCDCGVQISQSVSIPLSRLQENHFPTQNHNYVNPGLSEAVENISQRIGKGWTHLARELDIREFHIDQIRAQYPYNFKLQAEAALQRWLIRENENASVEILETALNARHCRRHGLSSHLLEPL